LPIWMGRFSAAFIGRSRRPTRLRVVMSSKCRSNDKPALQGLQRAIMARRLVQVLFPHEVSEPVHGAAVRCVRNSGCETQAAQTGSAGGMFHPVPGVVP